MVETEARPSQNAPTDVLYEVKNYITNKGDTIQEFILAQGEEKRKHPRFVIHTSIMVKTPDGRTQPFPFPIPIGNDTYENLDELFKEVDQIVAMGKEAQIKQIQEHESKMQISRGLGNMGFEQNSLIKPE